MACALSSAVRTNGVPERISICFGRPNRRLYPAARIMAYSEFLLRNAAGSMLLSMWVEDLAGKAAPEGGTPSSAYTTEAIARKICYKASGAAGCVACNC